MMDKKHNEPQDDSYYDALIKQRIGEALRNQSRKERLDLAQLEEWVEADRQRRRAKVKRILAVASCFIILCIGTFSLKFVFDPDDSIATAGKNDNKVTEEGNNVVVKPNEDGVDENTGSRTVTCSAWDDVKDLQKKFPKLLVPGYIPYGYTFTKLTIKYNDLIENYAYLYSDGENKIELKQVVGADTTTFDDYSRKLNCKFGDLFIADDEYTAAGCKVKDGTLYMLSKCSDDDILEIFNNIK